jgi:hypothetical protein
VDSAAESDHKKGGGFAEENTVGESIEVEATGGGGV